MGVTAYVLIATDPRRTGYVMGELGKLNPRAVREVMGPYDIVLKADFQQLIDVPQYLSGQVRAIEGVSATTTLVAFPED